MNKYRNKFEEKIGSSLEGSDVEFGYETERLEYTVSGKYTPDFIIKTNSGGKIYVESKGGGLSFDGHVKRKMIAVKEQHPDKDIRIVFYSNGKCGPRRKDGTYMRQLDWAARHGFVAAVGDIPEDWLV